MLKKKAVDSPLLIPPHFCGGLDGVFNFGRNRDCGFLVSEIPPTKKKIFKKFISSGFV